MRWCMVGNFFSLVKLQIFVQLLIRTLFQSCESFSVANILISMRLVHLSIPSILNTKESEHHAYSMHIFLFSLICDN